MSWFDTKRLASLTKTALKEAQKQIDKALDIQEDDRIDATTKIISADTTSTSIDENKSNTIVNTAGVKKRPGGANREINTTDTANTINIESPTTSAAIADDKIDAEISKINDVDNVINSWGSFTGSFFDNPNAREMITTPPKASGSSSSGGGSTPATFAIDIQNTIAIMTTTTTTTATAATISSSSSSSATFAPKRQSVTSNSDSVELLSPPTTSPCSEFASTSEVANNNSESIELITATSPSDINSSESCGGPSLPDSIVIIASNDINDEDEDSMSFKTVVDETLTTNNTRNDSSILKQQSSSCEDSKSFLFDADTPRSSIILGQSNSSTSTMKLLLSTEDIAFESQTVDSDSTQSFEDVQLQMMQASDMHASPKEATSSLTSEDKIDLIKSASQSYSSPPNSNDEMETTTSSDIEIISNPNGDSSSTNSTTRTSPLKAKKISTNQTIVQSTTPTASTTSTTTKKGHFREPSEISILSEDSQSELDKLLHRITELNELLEAREMRLLQSERQNALMQERNNELQTALDSFKGNSANADSAEEYTQRLSALEKKFQASIRERDALRIQIKTLKDELQNKIPVDNLTQMVAENKTIVEELKLEGEKLSKEILQQSNIIKKLRIKEKASDATLKKNKEQINSLTDDVERLKKSLNAKDEVERTQIEAVHKMSSEKRKLEDENAHLNGKLEDLQTKLMTLQSSFDAVKIELQQRTRLHSDLTRSAEEALEAKKEKEQTRAENNEILAQMNELREKLRYSETTSAMKEKQLRDENKKLLKRLEDAELRAELSTQEVSQTTIPLMRQLESLQNTISQRTTHWNKQEKLLVEQLENSQTRLKSLEKLEINFKDKIDILQNRCRDLEEQLSHSLLQNEKSKIALQQSQLDSSFQENNLNKKIATLNERVAEFNEKLQMLEEKNKKLEECLQEKNETSTALATSQLSVDEFGGRDISTSTNLNEYVSNTPELQRQQQHEQQQQQQLQRQQHGNCSPVNSLGVASLEDVMGCGSVDWQGDDLDCYSNSGRQTNNMLYGVNLNLLGHNTTTLEHLQALLKQRDGELAHLQWELSRLQAERGVLNEEISNLTLELEIIKEKLESFDTLERNYNDVQHRYDALLQMYGEKVERTQELELDLVELKEAYKLQIDELLAQPHQPPNT